MRQIALIFLCAVLASRGDETNEAKSVTIDSDAGFRMLHRLGLLDTSGAVFADVFLAGDADDEETHYYSPYRVSRRWRAVSGWVKPKGTNGWYRLTQDGIHETAFFDVRAAEPSPTGAVVGVWRERDPAEVALEVEEALGELMDADPFGSYHVPDVHYARDALLTAACLHGAGHTNDAHALAVKILASDQEDWDAAAAIKGAYAAIADARYGEALTGLYETADWQAFSAALDELLTTYRTGWDKLPQVKAIKQMIEKQSGDGNRPVWTGPELSKEEREIVDAILSLRHEDFELGAWGDSWVLPEPDLGKYVAAERSPVFQRIRKMGLSALPLLVKMLSSRTMLAVDRSRAGGGSTTVSWQDELGSNGSPAMLRDVAAAMWVPLLNRVGVASWYVDGEELIAESESWVAGVQGLTPKQLARRLASGDARSVRSEYGALIYLLRSTQAADRSFATNVILNAREPSRYADFMATYTKLLGQEDRALCLAYIDKLRPREEETTEMSEQTNALFVAEYEGSSPGELYGAGEQSAPATSISNLLSETATWDEMVGAMVTNAALCKARVNDGSFGRALEGHDREWQVARVLEAAVAASDPESRRHLVNASQQVGISESADYFRSRFGCDRKRSAIQGVPEAHGSLWSRLLEDDRPIYDPADGKEDQVRWVAVQPIMNLYGEPDVPFPETDAEWYAVKNVDDEMSTTSRLGRRGMDLVVEGAKKRLAGKQAAPLSAAWWATLELRDATIKKILAGRADDVAALTGKFSLSELLVLPAACETNADVNARLLPFANRVRHVESDLKNPEHDAQLRALQGKRLERADFDELQKLAYAYLDDPGRVMMTCVRGRSLDGVTIMAKRFDPKSADDEGDEDSDPVSELLAAVYTGEEAAMASWQRGKDSKAPESLRSELVASVIVSANQAIDGDETAHRREFWETVDGVCTGAVNVCTGVKIVFTNHREQDEPEETDAWVQGMMMRQYGSSFGGYDIEF